MKILAYILIITLMFGGWVAWANRNSMEMTGRQKIMKALYPILTGAGKLFGFKSGMHENSGHVRPRTSVYDLTVQLNDGSSLPLSSLRGKKILFVNTASDCGYTPQFDGLQHLHEKSGSGLVVIGFPANDFKEQEKGTDAEIGAFCRKNYGVSFPLSVKSTVVRGPQQHPVYQWLTQKEKNGWNDIQPEWNFSKYLVDENGTLQRYFGPSVEPDGKEIGSSLK